MKKQILKMFLAKLPDLASCVYSHDPTTGELIIRFIDVRFLDFTLIELSLLCGYLSNIKPMIIEQIINKKDQPQEECKIDGCFEKAINNGFCLMCWIDFEPPIEGGEELKQSEPTEETYCENCMGNGWVNVGDTTIQADCKKCSATGIDPILNSIRNQPE